MRRFTIVCACAAGVFLGGVAAYLSAADGLERLKNARQFVIPEEPSRIIINGTVVAANPEEDSFTVEILSPYQPQERMQLRVKTTEATQFSIQAGIEPARVPALPKAAPGLTDLQPGMSVIMGIGRQPGALTADRVTLLQ